MLNKLYVINVLKYVKNWLSDLKKIDIFFFFLQFI